jgi:hypothetical protein
MIRITKQDYIKTMHHKDRLLVFTDENMKVRGMVSWVLTNNPENMVREDIWSIPIEDRNGQWIFIDRLINDEQYKIRTNMVGLLKYFKQKFPDKKIIWYSRGKALHN